VPQDYNEYYLSDTIAEGAGLGKRMWLLKAPHRAMIGDTGFLGAVVEEICPFAPWQKNYPVPYHLTTPQLILHSLESRKDDLKISHDLVQKKQLAGASFSLTKSTGLSVEASSNVPGMPVSGSLSIDYSNTVKMTYSLEDGGREEYLRTGDLVRLAEAVDGDSDLIDTHDPTDIDDALIVDAVLLAKKYSVTFHQEKKIKANLEIEVENYGKGKVTFTRLSDYSFKLTFSGDQDYMIGFKTIDWDDLDDYS